MNAHKWQFASRFRRHAFGWRSDTPMQRIKEAIAEISKGHVTQFVSIAFPQTGKSAAKNYHMGGLHATEKATTT